MDGHVVSVAEMRNVYKIFLRKPERKALLRPEYRKVYNVKINLKRGCGLGSSGLGWSSLAGCSEDCNETSSFMIGGKFLD